MGYIKKYGFECDEENEIFFKQYEHDIAFEYGSYEEMLKLKNEILEDKNYEEFTTRLSHLMNDNKVKFIENIYYTDLANNIMNYNSIMNCYDYINFKYKEYHFVAAFLIDKDFEWTDRSHGWYYADYEDAFTIEDFDFYSVPKKEKKQINITPIYTYRSPDNDDEDCPF